MLMMTLATLFAMKKNDAMLLRAVVSRVAVKDRAIARPVPKIDWLPTTARGSIETFAQQ